MQKQYYDIKAQHEDAIVLFRLGDFYEGFNDDAKKMSKILGLTLTRRDKNNPIPMAGMPHHALNQYIHKLVDASCKIVIVDQVEDPKVAKGIVRREITQIITPGTYSNELVQDNTTNRYIAAAVGIESEIGVAYCDLSTGEFIIFDVSEDDSYKKFVDEIRKLDIKELIIDFSRLKFKDSSEKIALDFVVKDLPSVFIGETEEFSDYIESEKKLTSFFGVKTLKGFGISIDESKSSIIAAASLVSYLTETQKTSLSHIVSMRYRSYGERMKLDLATIRNLELFASSSGSRENSLYGILNKTKTNPGARLLRSLILSPFLNKDTIVNKLNMVECFVKNQKATEKLRILLDGMSDMQKIAGRIGMSKANAKDFLGMKNSILLTKQALQLLKELKSSEISVYLKTLSSSLEKLKKLYELIEKTINEDAPLTLNQGGLIKKGINAEIDELRDAMINGKEWIKNLEKSEIEKTKINSLKVRYNKVFGYYIEISKSNLSKVPDDYIRKQTLVNAERFITPDLKDVERKVLGAEEQLIELEYEIFSDFRENTKQYIEDIQKMSLAIAEIDVVANFASLTTSNRYSKPVIFDYDEISGLINIEKSRHPVIEQIVGSANYIPNDVEIDDIKSQILVVTGPNMSGKSTYIRQVALISLMAQIGCFVPATKAEISIVDRIFTRVGASDNLSEGQSTFMVEMIEAANIANNATKNSLIILDEIGRGTSTYDGVSIAWALSEYIHEKIHAKTLFATHYHELIELEEKFERITNYNVGVLEKENEVIFLRTVTKGATDKSYGIYVAQISGMPQEIIDSASVILSRLEGNGRGNKLAFKAKKEKPSLELSANQRSFFEVSPHEATIEKIKKIDLDNLSPKQALEKLYEIVAELKD